jgi:hypothetical protein
MGLLDEAIREHLELKRRSGADPSVIAREEREALAPVFPDEPIADGGALAEDAPEAAGIASTSEASEGPPYEDDQLADLSTAGQETAELDMQAVMDEDLDTADGGSPVGPVGAQPVPASSAGEMPTEESLDWESPGGAVSEAAPADIPGQERLSFE